MQKFLGTLFLVLILSVCNVFAQRPWQFSYPHKGQADSKVAKTTNSLYLFSDNTLSSYNHGLIWNDVLTLPGDVKGVTEVLNTVTIAVSQPRPSDPFIGFYTQNGTVWSAFDTIPSEGNTATCVSSHKNDYYIGTNSSKIYKRGEKTTILSVSDDSSASIKNLIINDDFMLVLMEGGFLRISTNGGTDWSDAMNGIPPTASPNPQVSAIDLNNGQAVAATSRGVYKFQSSESTWIENGTWRNLTPPNTVEVAGDGRRLICIAIVGSDFQMFRLESGDSVWIETAYPLPGSATISPILNSVIDGGWVVTYYSPLGLTDSSGIYIYNLDDFTSVAEESQPVVRCVSTDQGVIVETLCSSTALVTMVDVMGRTLYQQVVPTASQFIIPITNMASGTYGITVTPLVGTPLNVVFNH